MSHVRILPTTARLKQVIRQHGDTFVACGPPRPVACFGGDPAVLVASLDGSHVRNVRVTSIATV